MNTIIKISLSLVVVFTSINSSFAQHRNQLFVDVDTETHVLNIKQEIDYFNTSTDSISEIVLNDWNNAYSNVKTPLAVRFSDEFYRGFHLAKEEERGKTSNINIASKEYFFIPWERTDKDPDLVVVKLPKKLASNQTINLQLSYTVKIPSSKFTKFGYDDFGNMNLKNWFLTPARYESHAFVKYNNENLDDIANAISDIDIEMKVANGFEINTDLDTSEEINNDDYSIYKLNGKNRVNFSLFIEPKSSFTNFKSESFEVITNLDGEKVTPMAQAEAIDCVVRFVKNLVGEYPFKKIVISQTDYEKNPFYGLNQLPSFIRPFTDEFTYELKFLKTYLNVYLNNTLFIDNRKESWVHDGIQIYAMMKYIEQNYPNTKMMGNVSSFKLLKSFNLTNLDFNEQYSYFYMLMARKNLDQALGAPKNTLIKFNEQIASKYRAGLSLRFLDNYIENQAVAKSIHDFYSDNRAKQTTAIDFENNLKGQTEKDINWFFKTVIYSRDLIDYKFSNVAKTNDSVYFTLKNKTGINVPVPVYGINKGEIVFKKWLEPTINDSIFSVERNNASKIVLNYKNEVPEYNLRNNWKSLKRFFPNNRPIKFVFMKDLEDPYYNQILYVPTLEYNLYDGFISGMRLHNKTILDKPFIFDINPAYSTNAKTFSGSGSFTINQNYRNSRLYNVKYAMSGSYFHYAPDAAYTKLTPNVQIKIREDDFRDNRKQLISFRQILVNREKSAIITDNATENYSVFNAKYFNTKTEVTKHFNLMGDIQFSDKFGKIAGQIEYRKLFEDNRQINLRFYAGSFLYKNSSSDFFSFALDRPSDYLFDYGYYGRSESTGFYSQQLIIAEGGFKSKLKNPFANQWISTINTGYTIWNWIEMYGDVGVLKNRYQNPNFVFDSGIRLNLVTDYFELYLPVYSSNGWEISQNKYNEKIRFIIAFSPKILVNLFNRKWF
ncbi:gluzincin family metallopeptidase [Flavobacterium undicola]|uniref:aminopeptidase n=1 Tax=Flavobacterium undicola TaxID=1932779 RepID=UPI001F28A20A|nr:aminopeptidase [Flavobacterium undicola]